MENPIYCQMSRGKFESQIVNLIVQILFDFNKLASDLMLYSMKNFEFVTIPKEFCTGSSIMPQKNNPDVLELVRSEYSKILGEEMKLKSLISNLISGFNRDVQNTKEPVITSFETVKKVIKVMTELIKNLIINKENCEKAVTPELHETQRAYELVKKGKSFREAYKIIGKKYE